MRLTARAPGTAYDRPVADLLDAVEAGDVVAVEDILRRHPGAVSQRGVYGTSAVRLALYHGHPEVAHVLVAAGCDLDIFDAAALGRDDRLDILLDLQPDLARAWSGDDFTPLHLAAFFGHAGTVDRLLHAGAPVDAPNASSIAPLHSAAAHGSVEVVRLLLVAGAPVDARQRGGYTALHAAAQHGRAELAELLLVYGAEPSFATDAGWTAADLARQAGHLDLAARLVTRP